LNQPNPFSTKITFLPRERWWKRWKRWKRHQAVNCKELMKSFGWDTTDAFTQHDAQVTMTWEGWDGCWGWMLGMKKQPGYIGNIRNIATI